MAATKPNFLLIRVNDDPSFDFARLACALESIDASSWDLKSVTVCLDEYDYMDPSPSPELYNFFKAIGTISSLCHLKIYDSTRDGILPLSVISPLLHLLSHRLENLELSGLSFCGTSRELDDFGCAVQGLVKLEVFSFSKGADVVCTDLLQRDCVEALFNAVSHLPNIERVHGDIHWFLEGAPRRAYSDILSSCGQKLSLTLEIEPGMDGEAYKALEWDRNQSGELELSLFDEAVHGGASNPVQYLILLDLILQSNAGVTKVTLDLEGMEEQSTACTESLDDFWIQLSQLLSHHQTATNNNKSATLQVEVYVPQAYHFKSDATSAFAELLQNHFGLQVCFLKENPTTGEHEKEPAMHSQIDAYLCLNQNKRGYLMEHLDEISPSQWIESFAAVNNDPRCVHYYLSQLPWMCEGGGK